MVTLFQIQQIIKDHLKLVLGSFQQNMLTVKDLMIKNTQIPSLPSPPFSPIDIFISCFPSRETP